MYLSRFATVAALLLLVSACVNPTKITSNKAPGYSKELKRLFVMTDIGTEFGAAYGDSFARRMQVIAKDCGADLEISWVVPLELDSSRHVTKMKAFSPDAVLHIRRNGGTKDQYGNLFHVIYDSRLIDMPINKAVWRSSTGFWRGGTAIPIAERGEALAVDLTNKMKQDGLFGACKVIAVKQ